MAFIRKNWQKYAGANAVGALMRVGGAGVTAVATNYIQKNATGSGIKKTLGNLSAPAFTIVGVLLDLVADNENIRAFAQGMYTFGALKTASKFITVMGINGVEDDAIMNGSEIMDGAEIMDGLGENKEVVYVDEDGNVVNGIGETTPQEILDAQNGADPAGREFADVADYIEQGADNAVETTNGIGDFGDIDTDDVEFAESMM